LDILKKSNDILENARLLSKLDVSLSLADVALKNNYCKPKINKKREISLIKSRHPVIERLLPVEENFISNDIKINVALAKFSSIGVDTMEDYLALKKILDYKS